MSPQKNPKNQKGPNTTPDDLQRQLTDLKLPFIREHVEEFARHAAQRHWSHVDFLACLVEGEAAQRQDRARQRRIEQARFPVHKTLEQFDFTWPTKINRLQVQNLFRLKFIEDNANVILVGAVGLGKSHLAIALGYAACLAGLRVRFATAVDVVNTLSAADKAFQRMLLQVRSQSAQLFADVAPLGVNRHLLEQVLGGQAHVAAGE